MLLKVSDDNKFCFDVPIYRRKWATILDENFLLRMPVTPYRYFPASDVMQNERHVRGIDCMIRDTASLTVMVENLGRTSKEQVRIQFFAEAEQIIITGGNVSVGMDRTVACSVCHFLFLFFKVFYVCVCI